MACHVVFYEAFREEACMLRRFLPADIRAEFTAATIRESGHDTPPAALISTRTQSVIPDRWAPMLKGILTRSTGYDHVTAFRARTGYAGAAGYLPLYCNRAVAEQAMLLWMALLRKLPRQTRQFAEFYRDGITGRECRGRTLAVVGVGNIGREVADIGRGLGMEVLGVDPVRKLPDLTYLPAAEALPRADVVVCAMNLTDSNRGYFRRETLAGVRPGTVFVNIARGELAVVRDLVELLDEGVLGGVGLDVYEDEPELAVALRAGAASASASVRAVQELAARPDVVCTPHNAFNTEESVERKSAQSVEQIACFLESGAFMHPVP